MKVLVKSAGMDDWTELKYEHLTVLKMLGLDLEKLLKETFFKDVETGAEVVLKGKILEDGSIYGEYYKNNKLESKILIKR